MCAQLHSPGPIEYYLQINDASLRAKYNGHKKIPMQVFHDAYFEGQIDLAAGRDMLEVLEFRLDWASMAFTPELFKFVFAVLIPDVIRHTEKQDMEQVRDHYDREFGADESAVGSRCGGQAGSPNPPPPSSLSRFRGR
jgi:hypothetical protein